MVSLERTLVDNNNRYYIYVYATVVDTISIAQDTDASSFITILSSLCVSCFFFCFFFSSCSKNSSSKLSRTVFLTLEQLDRI